MQKTLSGHMEPACSKSNSTNRLSTSCWVPGISLILIFLFICLWCWSLSQIKHCPKCLTCNSCYIHPALPASTFSRFSLVYQKVERENCCLKIHMVLIATYLLSEETSLATLIFRVALFHPCSSLNETWYLQLLKMI